MIEIFKDIQGYEGLYQISEQGNVKALGNGGSNASKEKILKAGKNGKNGYLFVILFKQGKRKICYVHRLVAQAFIHNPNNYPIINHKDEDKTNNHVTNLEWCTYEYNNNYGTHTEKYCKPVLCLETGKIYPSLSEVKKQLGFNIGNISSACNGKRKTCNGFHWYYVS